MISIIIPNYNGEENLKRNLPKVIEAMETYSGDSELIIVDDASTDNSANFIKDFCSDRFETCHYHKNIKNLGFGQSCNLGVQKAKGEIVILLNNDVYPDIDFISPLAEHFSDDKVFAVGCLEKTLGGKGEIIGERGVGEIYFENGIFQHKAGDLNCGTTGWVCGGSGAFRRDIFLQLGGFDKSYSPFYWEDVDLSYRASRQGYKLLFDKKSVVYHKHIEGSIAKKYSSSEINDISFNNQIKFTKKHIGNFNEKLKFFIFRIKHHLI